MTVGIVGLFKMVNAHHILICFVVVVAFAASFLSSCGRPDPQVAAILNVADSLMQSRPDTVLEMLERIEGSKIGNREQAAKYALLHAMAIDRNYIDTTDMAVLQPAIDYYIEEEKGSPDDRLRSYYYQGRIYQNLGERAKAMKSFVYGISLAGQSNDKLTAAHMYYTQSMEYRAVYDMDNDTAVLKKAAILYAEAGREDLKNGVYMRMIDSAISLEDESFADSLVNLLDSCLAINQISMKNYAHFKLNYLRTYGSNEEIGSLLAYMEDIPFTDADDMMDRANAYRHIGEYDIALSYMDAIKDNHLPYLKHRFSNILSHIYKDMGRYEDAVETNEQFTLELVDEHVKIFEDKLLFAEEDFDAEMKTRENLHRKDKMIWMLVVGVVLLLLLMIIGILILRKHRLSRLYAEKQREAAELKNSVLETEAENRNLKMENLFHTIRNLKSEREILEKALEQRNGLPNKSRQVIRKRVEMLNSIIALEITSNDKYRKEYDKWIQKITSDSKYFVKANVELLNATHPMFIEFLRDHGLTEDELEYTCLYAIGISAVEVGRYLDRPSHRNMSSKIRKKLGLTVSDTNLGIFVRRKMEELS